MTVLDEQMRPVDASAGRTGEERSSSPVEAAMILVDRLEKRYPKRPTNAVDGVSFSVAPGEIFGLLGPNGAGKTTTIGILTTRVRATGGRAAIAGIDVATDPVGAKRRFAVVPQRNNLDRSLSARQNLLFHAAYFGFSKAERAARADTLLGEFGLGDRGDDKVDRYSGGMAQRLMIVRALMHSPDVLFLDEPTTGLDPQARLFVWDQLRRLNARGLTVLMTTHDMDEAEELCGRLAIMDTGKILALDTPAGLKDVIPGSDALDIQASFDDSLPPDAVKAARAGLVEALRVLPGVEKVDLLVRAAPVGPPAGGRPGGPPAGAGGYPGGPPAPGGGPPVIRVYATDATGMIAAVATLVSERGASISDLKVAKPSLEDVFIHLTGRGLR